MIWHILTIVCGILTAVSVVCPFQWSDVVFGTLVVIFGCLALRSFRRRAYN